MSDAIMALFFRLQTIWRRSSARSRRIVASVLGVGTIVTAGVLGSWAGATFALIVIVTAVAAMLFARTATDVRKQLEAIRKQLDGLNERISHFAPSAGAAADREEPPTTVVDLASVGSGNPGHLIAATLDRSVFPRLAAAMDIAPPATGTTTPNLIGADVSASIQTAHRPAEVVALAEGVATKNLMRQWKLGLRTGDLLACREVFSALVDTGDCATVAPMRFQLEALTERIAAIHRATFRQQASSHDLAAMLETGRQISQLLPDHPLAAEVRAIEDRIKQRRSRSQANTLSARRVLT